MNAEKQVQLISQVSKLQDKLFLAKEACKIAYREVKEIHQHYCPDCPGDCTAGEVMDACKAVIGDEVTPTMTTLEMLRRDPSLFVDCDASRIDTPINWCGTGWYSLNDRGFYVPGTDATYSRIRILDTE